MFRTLKKILSVTVAVAMSFTVFEGCTAKKDDSAKDDKYLSYIEKDYESDIPSDYKIQNFYYDRDNKLNTVASNEKETAVFSENKDKVSLGWLDKLSDDTDKSVTVFLGKDNSYYALIGTTVDSDDPQNPDYRNFLMKLSDDMQTAEDITPSKWAEKYDVGSGYTCYPMIGKVMITEDSKIIYTDIITNELCLCDNGSITTISPSVTDFAVNENTLYFIDINEKKMSEYDLSCNALTDNVALEFSTEGALIYADSEEIFVVSKAGIHKLTKDGTIWEEVLDGAENTLGSSSYMLDSLTYSSNDGFKIIFYASDSYEQTIKTYTLQEVAETETKKLTIFSMHPSQRISEAIIRYKKLHPEIEIDFVVGRDGTSDATTTEIIKKLNTQIFSGDGADIICLDGLPYDSYIENNVLCDLSDVFVPMINNNELLENISKNYYKDGKVYFMPVQFAVPLFVNTKNTDSEIDGKEITPELLSKYSEDLTAKDLQLFSDKRILFENNQNEEEKESIWQRLLSTYIYSYYDTFINADGTINKEEYKKLLEETRQIADDVKDKRPYLQAKEFGNYDNKVFQMLNLGDLIDVHNNGVQAAAYLSYTLGCENQLYYYMLTKDNTDIKVRNFNNKFVPDDMLGLNSTSKLKDEAKEFIKYMYSDEIQKINLLEGYPVNASVFNGFIDSDEDKIGPSGITYGYTDDSGTDHDIYVTWPDKTARSEWKTLITNADSPIFNNEIIYNILIDNAKDYFEGNKTSDQTVQDTATSLDLYLSE